METSGSAVCIACGGLVGGAAYWSDNCGPFCSTRCRGDLWTDAAEIASLRAEIVRLQLQGHSLFGKWQDALAEELERLRAERDALSENSEFNCGALLDLYFNRALAAETALLKIVRAIGIDHAAGTSRTADEWLALSLAELERLRAAVEASRG